MRLHAEAERSRKTEQKDGAEAGTALRPPRRGVSVLVSALDSPERMPCARCSRCPEMLCRCSKDALEMRGERAQEAPEEACTGGGGLEERGVRGGGGLEAAALHST